MAGSWSGLAEFEAATRRITNQLDAATRDAVAEAAGLLEKTAKKRASGRPGPNVITGTLRRSIVTDAIRRWGERGWQTQVGPTAIYGRRVELEYGYAYFVPAWRTVKLQVQPIFAKHWRRALR